MERDNWRWRTRKRSSPYTKDQGKNAKSTCGGLQDLQVNAKRRKDFDDIKAKLNTYAEYDKVWYLTESRKEGACQKLQPLYLGPCLVLQKLSDFNYKIQLAGQGTMNIVNHDKLKHYRDCNIIQNRILSRKLPLKVNKGNNITICKLPTSNIKLPIETDRWQNVQINDRISKLCNEKNGNACHYHFEYQNPEIKNQTRYELILNYYTANSSIHTIKGMFSFCNKRVLNSLCA